MPKTKKTIKKAVKKKTTKKVKKVEKKAAPKKDKAVKEKPAVKPARYFEAVGRRKTAVARVRLFTQGEKVLLVNEKPYKEYFSTIELQQIAISPLTKMKCLDRFRGVARIKGGGVHAQAEALKHGLARVLIVFNPTFRKRLKKAGYLTRDSRKRERKKFGLRRARRAPQWKKR